MIKENSLKKSILLILLITEDEDVFLLSELLLKRTVIYNKIWYDHSLPLYDEIQFKSVFRMEKSCIENMINMFFTKYKGMCSYFDRKCFYMLVYYAMYNISYRSLAEKFGEPSTTCFRRLTKILKNFNIIMYKEFIKRPTSDEMIY